jgi:hypothetical protein
MKREAAMPSRNAPPTKISGCRRAMSSTAPTIWRASVSRRKVATRSVPSAAVVARLAMAG